MLESGRSWSKVCVSHITCHQGTITSMWWYTKPKWAWEKVTSQGTKLWTQLLVSHLCLGLQSISTSMCCKLAHRRVVDHRSASCKCWLHVHNVADKARIIAQKDGKVIDSKIWVAQLEEGGRFGDRCLIYWGNYDLTLEGEPAEKDLCLLLCSLF